MPRSKKSLWKARNTHTDRKASWKARKRVNAPNHSQTMLFMALARAMQTGELGTRIHLTGRQQHLLDKFGARAIVKLLPSMVDNILTECDDIKSAEADERRREYEAEREAARREQEASEAAAAEWEQAQAEESDPADSSDGEYEIPVEYSESEDDEGEDPPTD